MSHSAVQRLTRTRELTSAIVVTARNVLTHAAVSVHSGTNPLTRIAGLTLFQRTLLTLQRAGIHQVFILAAEEADMLKAALAEGPPVTVGVRWIPVREFPLEDPRTWETLAADANGACLIVGPQAAFSRAMIEQLRGVAHSDDLVVVLRPDPERGPTPAPQDRTVLRKQDRLAKLADGLMAQGAHVAEGTYVATELVLVPAGGFLRGSPLAELLLTRGAEDQAGETPLARLVEAAAAERRIRVVEPGPGSASWAQEVHDVADAQAVERSLYRSLKSNFEGFVDRMFNRRLSPFFTKMFLSLHMSPNMITLVATLIGLVSAACFASGSYTAGLIGAVLFQLSAVIDCCDGEVARLTFAESPFGAKLDIWLDNLVHMAIFAGIAYGAYSHPPAEIDAQVFLWAGAAAILANAVSFWGVTQLAVRQENGTRSRWTDFLLKNLATRDFSVVVAICAAVGQLPFFLVLAAAGSLVFGLLTVGLLVFQRPARA